MITYHPYRFADLVFNFILRFPELNTDRIMTEDGIVDISHDSGLSKNKQKKLRSMLRYCKCWKNDMRLLFNIHNDKDVIKHLWKMIVCNLNDSHKDVSSAYYERQLEDVFENKETMKNISYINSCRNIMETKQTMLETQKSPTGKVMLKFVRCAWEQDKNDEKLYNDALVVLASNCSCVLEGEGLQGFD